MDYLFYIVPVLFVLGIVFVLLPMMFRVVVPTNEVHIIQTGRSTVSYGKDYEAGNSYYRWYSWIPFFGVQVTIMPVSVFSIDLEDYESYDEGRLPFLVDAKAFFRITDANTSAQRVSDFKELSDQLLAIVQGAIRTVLATNTIDEIMTGRGTFGEQFTNEVRDQLKQWGVEPVKNIELMDIRDVQSSTVIKNIMEKKKSQIDSESRQEVAKNKRAAEIAETEAQRETQMKRIAAEQDMGLRKVEAQRMVQLANEESAQVLKEQEKLTKEKEMAVARVQEVKSAEITKEVQVIQAQMERETLALQTEAELDRETKRAEGVRLQGSAKADSEKALLMAPVEAQVTLAREIGANKDYQQYLITVRQIEAMQAIGIEQAGALESAEIKIIANSSGPTDGLNSVMDLFSAKGGANLGAAIEAFKSTTDTGKKVFEALN